MNQLLLYVSHFSHFQMRNLIAAIHFLLHIVYVVEVRGGDLSLNPEVTELSK